MELFLNLFWLFLALPAFWIWRQAGSAQENSARSGCRIHSRCSLLLVACVVLLLFPIISASDDLQAMRPEVEESCSRDTQRHVQGYRHAVSPEHAPIFAVMPQNADVIPYVACLGIAVIPSAKTVLPADAIAPSGRAPPVSPLA